MAYTLANAMLALARVLGGVEEGVATGGSTSTLIDTSRTEQAGYWEGGTLFALSGNNSGKAIVINTYDEDGTFYVATQSLAYAAADRYVAVPSKFPKYKLRMAINNALAGMFSLKMDATKTVTASTQSYSLPSGVSNIVKVEVAASDTTPYDYGEHFFWYEVDGYLHFMPGKEPSSAGKKIRMWYRAPIVEVTSDSSTLPNDLDLEHLKWKAAVYAYRDIISQSGKDNQTDIELMNEAIKNEALERSRIQGSASAAINRRPILGGY